MWGRPLRKACPPERLGEDHRERELQDRPAAFVAEGLAELGVWAKDVGSDRPGDVVGQWHRSVRRRRLKRAQYHAGASHAHQLLPDLHPPLEELDPVDGEAEQFGPGAGQDLSQ
jgi:hypothetical protein